MQEQKINSPLNQEIEMKWHDMKSINQSTNWIFGSESYVFLLRVSQEPDVSTSAQYLMPSYLTNLSSRGFWRQ